MIVIPSRGLILSFAALMSLFVGSAKASVVYSGRLDIEGPDITIDINNDNQNDLSTYWYTMGWGNGYSAEGFEIGFNSGVQYLNTELGGLYAGEGLPGTKAPLEYGTLITSTPPEGLLWSCISNNYMMGTTYDMFSTPSTTYTGVWHNTRNKYIGFELFDDNSNSYYGWLRLETDNQNNVKLIDYAYESVPNTPIAAGVIPVFSPNITGSTPTRDTTPTWRWTSGGGGIGRYRYRLNSGAWVKTRTTSFVPPMPLSAGRHTLYVQESDADGNWSVAGNKSIVIDLTSPAAPTVSTETPTVDTTPTWHWSRGGGGNGNFRYRLDSGTWTKTRSLSFTPPMVLSAGNHILRVQESDKAGNWSSSGKKSIMIEGVETILQ